MRAQDVQDAQDSGISKKDTAFSKKEYSENLHMVHILCTKGKNSPVLHVDPFFVKALKPLDRLLYGWCDNCCILNKTRKVALSHKAVLRDGNVLLLCPDCAQLVKNKLGRRDDADQA